MKEQRRRILYSREEILERVESLGEEISRRHEGDEIVFICVLKGAFMFLADLVRHVRVPHAIDFVRLASYGCGSESSGTVTVTKDIELPLAGRHVIIVEDIIDSGLTLSSLRERIEAQGPASVEICTLIDKRGRRKMPAPADYVGFVMDDGFIVGYGLDFDEQYRYLPDICVIEDL
ncbi:MAG: hypoxanthine phosphoribosyltransferase [Deltaproteobacteria bacterium]|nr:hypoxanthine phosphoribosyltransferase [Deltaproteobacteria bacterium]